VQKINLTAHQTMFVLNRRDCDLNVIDRMRKTSGMSCCRGRLDNVNMSVLSEQRNPESATTIKKMVGRKCAITILFIYRLAQNIVSHYRIMNESHYLSMEMGLDFS